MPNYSKITRSKLPRSIKGSRLIPSKIRFGRSKSCKVFGKKVISGSSIKVKLFSDIFRDDNGRRIGENPFGLKNYVQDLNQLYPQTWVQGHLLNQDFGGSGDHKNLTILTVAANNAHKIFENHIRNIGRAIINYETDVPKSKYWYYIEYSVIVSRDIFLEIPDENHELNSVYSHISLEYSLKKTNKNDYVEDADICSTEEIPLIPDVAYSLNRTIRNFYRVGNTFKVEIHNCEENLKG